MGFDFKAAELAPGRTAPLTLHMLPGKPTIHVEHLGESNAGYWADQIARANTAKKEKGGKREDALTVTSMAEAREKNRKTLAKHAVRDISAVRHADGSFAKATDIPEFCDKIPARAVDFIRDFVIDPENFVESVEMSDPDELAGK